MPSLAQWTSSKASTSGSARTRASTTDRMAEKKLSRTPCGSVAKDGFPSGGSIPSSPPISAALRADSPGVLASRLQQRHQASRELLPRHSRGVLVEDAALGPQDLGERPVDQARAVGQAVAVPHRGWTLAVGGEVPIELEQQARLADAGLADQRHEMRATVAGGLRVDGPE